MDLARHFPGFLHANATDHHCWISMSDSASIFAQTTASDQFPVLCDIGSRCMLASDHSLALNHRKPHHHPVDNTNAIVDTKCTIKKRESMAVSDITSSVISSSIPVHGCGMEGIARTSETNIFGGGKRRRNSKKQAEKLREVIHVRAKRGQAADNHSLAERARREKINERIRCLQELVPGCYKTMGMAVTLDEIINYVQSLQNQVEFLSMKLSAASSLCDFNSDTEPGQISYSSPCARDNPYEARDMEWLVREAYDGAAATTRFCPFDFTFGSCLHSPFSSSLCSKWKCT